MHPKTDNDSHGENNDNDKDNDNDNDNDNIEVDGDDDNDHDDDQRIPRKGQLHMDKGPAECAKRFRRPLLEAGVRGV